MSAPCTNYGDGRNGFLKYKFRVVQSDSLTDIKEEDGLIPNSLKKLRNKITHVHLLKKLAKSN